MGWNHEYKLKIGPPSTNENVENVDEVKLSKNQKRGIKTSYIDIVIGDKKIHKNWSHYSGNGKAQHKHKSS